MDFLSKNPTYNVFYNVTIIRDLVITFEKKKMGLGCFSKANLLFPGYYQQIDRDSSIPEPKTLHLKQFHEQCDCQNEICGSLYVKRIISVYIKLLQNFHIQATMTNAGQFEISA